MKEKTKRRLTITYGEEPVNMDMLDEILSCFNQDMTIGEARKLINWGVDI